MSGGGDGVLAQRGGGPKDEHLDEPGPRRLPIPGRLFAGWGQREEQTKRTSPGFQEGRIGGSLEGRAGSGDRNCSRPALTAPPPCLPPGQAIEQTAPELVKRTKVHRRLNVMPSMARASTDTPGDSWNRPWATGFPHISPPAEEGPERIPRL
ncbi:unnamed protein product [Rangifer tarandus platyrhynchus]|uniref:Uncharacterized protein n=1 Tax=Rangifer tarandus platyrhynchus TaxID=3082113 RepID=A0AC59Y7A2_RANTA